MSWIPEPGSSRLEPGSVNLTTWPFWFRERTGLNPALPPIALGVAIFTLGALISVVTGFTSTYLRTGTVYLIMSGISVMSLVYYAGNLKYVEALSRIDSVFDVPRKEYDDVVETWLDRLYDDRPVYSMALVHALVFGTLVYLDFSSETDILPQIYPQAWYTDGFGTPGVFSLLLVGVISPMVAAGVWKISCHLFMIRAVMNLPLKDVRSAALGLNPLLRLNFHASMAYLLGLIFVVLVMGFETTSISGLVLVSCFAALGLSLFLTPEYLVHRAIQQEKQRTILEHESVISDKLRKLQEADQLDDETKEYIELNIHERRIKNIEELNTWAFSNTSLLQVAGATLGGPIVYTLQLLDLF